MTKQKKRPTVGDECWVVEWCSKLAFYDDMPDEVDRDSCTMKTRSFATKEEAAAFAKEIWPQTHETFGVVDYWPVRFVPYDEDDAVRYPHAGHWEATADAETYDGEVED